MVFTLTRGAVVADARMGTLRVNDQHICDTLERESLRIPAGRYPLKLTYSERAKKKELWTPRKDANLPLVDQVPARSGIRIHAGNRAADTIGCVLVGKATPTIPGEIHESRATLTALIGMLDEAGECWLQVNE